MVKIPGPLLGMEAHGWLGHDLYKRRGVVLHPYPIGFASHISYPYRMTKFNLRPYGGAISFYYNALGWVYQRRRTWHGVTWAAIRPPISVNKKTAFQLGYQGKFYNAVASWHTMSQATKDVYAKWTHPVHASGYNRFLSWYMKHTAPTFLFGDTLLMEDGFRLLQQDGGRILLEHFYLLTEAGDILVTDGVNLSAEHFYLLTEADEVLLTESGLKITSEYVAAGDKLTGEQ